jgi:5-formyltetrahydrofolate cyclo-ligase
MTAPDDRAALRRALRSSRSAFVADLDGPARTALERALAAAVLPHLGAPGVVAAYWPMGAEISPLAITAAADAAGWQVVWPRARTDGPLRFHLAAASALVPGHRGIPEPPADAPVLRPDVLLIPLLGADAAGNRLGQGGGHYDRTLAEARAHGPVLAVGLGFDLQLIDRVPAAPWDQPLDAIATPSGFRMTPHHAR